MKNAVIYARYSSHGQNEQTIDGQIRVCQEYAKQLKLNVINIYTDKHKTGRDDNRPEFQRMIADAATKTFSYVIVYMIDRFARNRYYSTIYNFQLSQNNVKLISATENISESEEGEFYQMFLEWNAEKYSQRLAKRVKEGITTSIEHGNYIGGHRLFGYNIENKKVYINEQEAKVVKYVYERYAKGISKKEIAKELNKMGYRHNSKLYVGRDLDKMLLNAKYTGEYLCGGRICNKTFPAIINKELYDKVQEQLKKNKHDAGAKSAKVPYLLQGKVYCGYCGAKMTAEGGTSKTGAKHYYYACVTKRKSVKNRECTKTNEKKDYLENYVVEQIVKYLSDEKKVEIIANDVIKYYESRVNNNEIKRLASEKIRIQKEIDNAVNLLISGVSKDVVKTLDKKIVEHTRLLNDIDAHKTKLELERGLMLTKEDIQTFIAIFIKGDTKDKSYQKRIIDNLLNAVYIFDDKVVIYFNLNNEKETTFITKEDTEMIVKEQVVKSSNSNALGSPKRLKSLDFSRFSML